MLFLRQRDVDSFRENWHKLAQFSQSMVWFRGKCAGCGAGSKHQNFKGCREGRLIPDPCHAKLRYPRPAKDDRLCTVCYNDHLKCLPAPSETPSSSSSGRRRSSTTSLDGVAWSSSDSERVAKVAWRDSDGNVFIPLHVHKEKIAEVSAAFRREEAMLLEQQPWRRAEEEAMDGLDILFRHDGISSAVKASVFARAVRFYKEAPSAGRAQLFMDLSNEMAKDLVGISSKTLQKARSGDIEPSKPAKRLKRMKSGLLFADVQQIAQEACFDARFCEIRSWKTFSGGESDVRWECIALVDVLTIWKTLCDTHGEFCSIRTFYHALPPYFVHKKKDRCVCKHCKDGRQCLDDATVIINALRSSARGQDDFLVELKKLRLDLMDLYGHLEKELVIGVADGRHAPNTNSCDRCGLLKGVENGLKDAISKFEGHLQISARDWALLFPGVELPAQEPQRRARLLSFIDSWPNKLQKYVDHLLLKADRIQTVDSDVAALRGQNDAEVWFSDYSMPVKLVGTWNETEADFLSKETANILGFMRMYWHEGELWREYWDFVFEGAKDIQASMQIQLLLLSQIQEEREKRGMCKLRKLKIWADNANDFKGGDMWGQWQKELARAEERNGEMVFLSDLSVVELNYHAAGEGKTQLDAHFGHLNTIRAKRERMKLERRTVGDLLIAMSQAEATHVVQVDVWREKESRFYRTVKGATELHRIQVTGTGLKAQKNSRLQLKSIELGQVKERQTKNARRVRQLESAAVMHTADLSECQTCCLKMGKNESVDDWMMCDECDRSWHKVCVGYNADADLNILPFSCCKNCGGADPVGPSLKKQRKVSTCRVCHERIKGIDHSQCKRTMEQQEADFRTPEAILLARRDHSSISRKFLIPAKEKRAKRAGSRRKGRSGTKFTREESERLRDLL